MDGVIFPCIYALLPNKTEAIYDKLFKKLLEIEPLLNPLTIMVDCVKRLQLTLLRTDNKFNAFRI